LHGSGKPHFAEERAINWESLDLHSRYDTANNFLLTWINPDNVKLKDWIILLRDPDSLWFYDSRIEREMSEYHNIVTSLAVWIQIYSYSVSSLSSNKW
jgi:hypothetical protein